MSTFYADDVVYGVSGIARALNLTERQVHYYKDVHRLPVFRIGRKVCARKSTLATWFARCEEAAARIAPDGKAAA